MNRRVLLRIGRWAALGAGGLLLFVAAGLIGLVLYLRSEAGENRLKALLEEALADTDVGVSVGELRGPLPNSLVLRDFILSDAQGPWLNVPELALHLDLFALLQRRVVVRELVAVRPELFRLPVLPPAQHVPEPEPETVPSDPLGILEGLPGGLQAVEVRSLQVQDLRLGAAVPEGPLVVSLRASALVEPGVEIASCVELDAGRTLEAVTDALKFEARLSSDKKLDLRLSFSEQENGLLQEKGTPAAPHLLLEGSAPLESWNGSLNAGLAGMLEIHGRLGRLTGAQQDGLETSLEIVPSAAAPELWRSILGERLAFDLALVLGGGTVSAESLSVVAPAWQVRAKNLGLHTGVQEGATLSGRIVADVSHPEALKAVASLPFTSLGLKLDLAGTPEAPAADLAFDMRLPSVAGVGQSTNIAPGVRGDLHVKTQTGPVTADGATSRLDFTVQGGVDFEHIPGLDRDVVRADLRLEGGQSGKCAAVRLLEIDSPLLRAKGRGVWSPKPEDVSAQLELSAPDLTAPAALAGLSGVAGRALLLLDVAQDKDAALSGTLRLDLADMRWGRGELNALLGPVLRLNLDAGAALTAPGGANRGGLPDMHVARLELAASGLMMGGRAEVRRGRLDAVLDATLREAGLVLPSLKGEVKAHIRGEGAVDAPTLRAEVFSPVLGINGQDVRELRMQAEADMFAVAPFSGSGGLTVTGTVDGEAQHLSFRWNADRQQVRVEAFQGRLAGVDLKGSLAALFAGPRLEGSVTAGVADWAMLARFAPITGKNAEVKVHFAPSGGKQDVVAEWSVAGLRADDGMRLNSLQGEARIADAFGVPRFELRAAATAGKAAGLSWKSGRALAQGSLQKAELEFDLEGAASGSLRAAWAEPVLQIERMRFRDAASGLGAELAGPARIEIRNGLEIRNLDLRLVPGGSLKLDGTLGGRGPALTAAVKDIPIGLLRQFVSAPIPDGVLGADVALRGSAQRPEGTFRLSLGDLKYPDSLLPPAALDIRGTLQSAREGSMLSADLTASGLDAREAKGSVRVPLIFSADGIPAPAFNRPLSGEMHWDGPIAPVWRFVPLADRRLSGQGKVDVRLSGTLAAPDAHAVLHLRKGHYEDLLLGLLLDDIELDADIRPFASSELSLKASDGQGGLASLAGTLGSAAQGMPLNLQGNLKNLKPLPRNDLRMALSGKLHVEGPVASPQVQASVSVDEGELRLAQLPGGGITELDVINVNLPSENGEIVVEEMPAETQQASASSAPGSLDVTVSIPNHFFVRGHGLESEWGGLLSVTGPFDRPNLEGQLKSVRGTMTLLGKEFALSTGIVSFEGGVMPFLNIVLTYDSNAITAEASVSGPAERPRLVLSSRPALPQDEIVSQVLFGRSASGLSRLEALQLAAAVGSLAGFGNGAFGLLDMTRDVLGMDVVRLGSADPRKRAEERRDPFSGPSGSSESGGEEPAPTIEVGKYVLDNVYVGLEQGMGPDTSGVRVEVELGPHTNFEAKTTNQASEAGINWKWDY